ncbi:calcium calmodulin-dependent protein, partial [Chrysochromulina tobinii]|eukprot:jgi/Chrpa1/10855/Chrysochromulina_OHIO_Genome00015419-RA
MDLGSPPGALDCHQPHAATAALQCDRGTGCFGEHWTLNRLLGHGCSARVYVARGLGAHGGEAACKLAKNVGRVHWPRVVRTFAREAELMRRCHHPNLVECLGFFHGEDELALLMTLAPGGDCQQLLQRHGALSERAATAIVQQLAAALHYMHTGPGVLHRDVKLENVLVSDVGYTATGTPRIKLCDFGHSCLLEGSCHGAARDDGFRGTQGYAAPEVAQPGAPPLWTTAADVWGVGVVYYALLANE